MNVEGCSRQSLRLFCRDDLGSLQLRSIHSFLLIATTLIRRGFAHLGMDTSRPSIRVLIVDDFEPWRRSVCSMLRENEELQVVGEAADGSEAVQKARTLQPDLILLDIGLPKLNGIDAARQIRLAIPGVKIIFVSQDNDEDVIRAVLRAGAQGYVLKANAGTELLPAIAAVADGHEFVGGGKGTTRKTARERDP